MGAVILDFGERKAWTVKETTTRLVDVWGKGAGEASHLDFGSHVQAIAHARYIIRRIIRLLDERAIASGLQPLQHQALLQIYGAGSPLPVNKVAERLDISAALASRLIRKLEEMGLVERTSLPGDRRIIAVKASEAGIERLRAIDEAVHTDVHYFQSQLTEESKLGALTTFAFYLGLDSDTRLGHFLNEFARQERVSDDKSEPGS